MARFWSSAAAVLAAMFILAAPAAHADAVIDQAKAQGVVGEQSDGYLGVVNASAASDAVKRRVQEINAMRREAYTRLSESSGESIATVAALTAEKQFARARSGEYLNPGSGWVKK
ncbi:MAG: YdbL family protein [Pseudomonadota bacterium]